MNESYRMISDDDDDTMPDYSDMNQEETSPVVNPFQDVLNDNLEEVAIQKYKGCGNG